MNESIEQQIMADLNDIVLRVTEWAEDLLIEYIDRYVYDWGERMKSLAETNYGQLTAYYIHNDKKPTGQFRRSIVHEDMHSGLANYIGYMIFSDPEKMDYDGKDGLHGDEQHDYRAVLMERLNRGMDDIPNNAKWRWWTLRTNFFDLYIEYLDKHIYQQFEKEMTRKGMNWRREG